MRVRSVRSIVLNVSDRDRSKRFYGEALGLPFVFELPDGHVAVFDAGGSSIVLHHHAELSGRPPQPEEAGATTLTLAVDDVDAAIEELRASGAEIVAEPADQPWGDRVGAVRDPDGYWVNLATAAPPDDLERSRPEELLLRTRSNELELWRGMLRSAGGSIVEEEGALLLVGPVPSLSAAFRLDPTLDAGTFLERCTRFYRDRSTPFLIVAQVPQDADLKEACLAAGFEAGWTEHVMALDGVPARALTPEGFEIRPVRDPEDVRLFAEVVAAANEDPERERARLVFARPESVLSPDVAAFLAWDADGPVSAAMTLVSHGVAGVFWVATIERARRRGLGDALTRAAARAGLQMGASVAWLGASEMGKGVYERIGFEPIGRSYLELGSPR